MVNELTISKGSISVTIYATDIAENYTNKLFPITGATGVQNQATGPSPTRIVDLLRIVHQIVIKCYITGSDTKTAKEVKAELVSIFKGANISGGISSLVYDGNTINGYIEKLNIVEKAADNQLETDKEFARYEVALTFIEGIAI